MSIKNFIPMVWSKQFEKEADRHLVFKEDCNTDHEGEVKEPGDSVKILTPGKPSTRTFHDGKLHKLDDPEEISGTSMTMPLNEVTDYHFAVDDLDKRQAEGSVKEVYMSEAAKVVANVIDQYIAKFAIDKNIVQEKPSTATTADTILDLIDDCVSKLYENDVTPDTELILTARPKFFRIMRKAYEKLDTDNSAMLKNGRIGQYHNVKLKMSNNVYKDDTYEYIMLRTKKSVVFVNQFVKTEAYRPEKTFEDAVKGVSVYGGKVVRPKEIITLAVKYA